MMIKRLTICLLLLATAAAALAQGSVLASGRWWKLGVEEDGMYRLRVADLPALKGAQCEGIAIYGRGAGMLLTANRFVSTGDMPQLHIDVVDHNQNGLFDEADEVLFYAEGASRWVWNTSLQRWQYEHHGYADRNYYYITLDAAAPLRIEVAAGVEATHEQSTFTAVANVDNDLVNIFETGQKWMGEIFNSALTERTLHLGLPKAATGASVSIDMGVANKAYTDGWMQVSTSGFNDGFGFTSSMIYNTLRSQFASSDTAFDIHLRYTPGGGSATVYLDYIELTRPSPISCYGGQQLMRFDPIDDFGAHRFVVDGWSSGQRVWDVAHMGAEREMSIADGQWTDSTSGTARYIIFDGTRYLSPVSIEPFANQNLHGAEQADMVIVSNPLFMPQAQKLAALHEVMDGMRCLVVTDQEVFDEYSAGMQDPMAIRTLLRDMADRYPDQAPQYLLLFGKATFDHRNITEHNLPIVVTYETPYSFDDAGQSYASDDMMGYLGEYETGVSSETLDVSVGRLPAKSTDEANHLVDKIEGYMTRRDLLADDARGDWRNYVALLADDADPGSPHDSVFAHSSEVVAQNVAEKMPHINFDKLYADSYHQSSGAIGSYYPDLNNALRKRMNAGCLLINYIGHGSVTYIGTERYIELSDLASYTNTDRLPLFVTSTCSYGHQDRNSGLCGAEAAVLAPGGAVAVVAPTRPISHIERFNSDVVCFAVDPANTIGDALRLAKNRTAVAMCIGLVGDPALRLSIPQNRVVVTHINSQPVSEGVDDTATVLSRVTVRGEVRDADGVLIPDFDGTLYPIVFDRVQRASTLANDNPGTEVAFTQQKNILYHGSHDIRGGRFEYSFVVPKDVPYQYEYAKLSHYARSGSDHATGSYHNLLLGGLNDTVLSDDNAPRIRLFVGDTNFRNGGLTDASPTLLALLSDSAGINTGAGLGHDITAMIDGNPGSLVVLNDLFESDVDAPGNGTVRYTFADLTPGRHTLTLKAWNIFNVSAEATLSFVVRPADTLAFGDLVCSPNPAHDQTTFALQVNSPDAIDHAELFVYSAQGQVVAQTEVPPSTDGYFVGPVRCDLRGVHPGLYMAQMVVTATDGSVYRHSTKCVVQ